MNHGPKDTTERVVKMFEEGKRFTEELMQENERLRLVAARLENELLTARTERGERDAARLEERIRLLEQENVELREELREIKQQYADIERENWDFSERYLQVEQQNTSLLNLYVAVQRLHSAADLGEAVGVVKEIIVNLIGSESFAVWLVDQETERMIPIAHEGGAPRSPRAIDAQTAGVVASGAAVVREPGRGGAEDGPVACIPMKLGSWIFGVIVIEELLSQKTGLEPIDRDLMELLADHAAATLCSAHLVASAAGLETRSRAELVREVAACAGALSEPERTPVAPGA